MGSMAPDTVPPLAALGDEAFVSLTTFRKSGEAVSTPVWVAREGADLLVVTPTESGKVKRLRNSGRVELRPCSRTGAVAENAVPVPGLAEIVADPAETEHLIAVIRAKYGVEYRVMMFIERVVARRRKPRVVVRIRAAAPKGSAAPELS